MFVQDLAATRVEVKQDKCAELRIQAMHLYSECTSTISAKHALDYD
jgi:hypothetical protein